MSESNTFEQATASTEANSLLFREMNKRRKTKFKKDLKLKINDLTSLLEVSVLLSGPVKFWFDLLNQKLKLGRN